MLKLLAVLIVTMTTSQAFSPGWAIQCDGIDDWATLPVPALPETWTFETWVKFGSVDDAVTVFDMHAGDNNILRVLTSSNGDSTLLQVIIGGGTARSVANAIQTSFTHMAIVVERTTGIQVNVAMFINGTKVFTSSAENLETTAAPVEVGLCYSRQVLSSMDVREKFGDVVIDDVRLWGEARTLKQIADTMSVVPIGPKLLHWWAMDDGDGVIVTDSVQGSHGDMAKRRHFTSQRPTWVPSGAPTTQVNFVAIVGVMNRPITLSLPDGSATLPSTFTPTTMKRTQIPFTVSATGRNANATFDVVVRQKPPPIAGGNKGMRLDGVSSYSLSTDFQVPTSFSIDMWLHPRSFHARNMNFCSKHTQDGANVFQLEVSLKNLKGVYEPTLLTRIRNAKYDGGTLLFEPQHLAIVATADLVKNVTSVVMYRNGEILFQANISDILVYDGGQPWSMGQDFDRKNKRAVTSDYFDGTVDEYRFWSRPLTQSEVHHSMTNAIDHGPAYPHLLKAFSFDSTADDDEYTTYGPAVIEPCESGLEARPLSVSVEEGRSISFTLPALDPEGSALLTYSLVQSPSHGKTALDPVSGLVTYTALKNKYDVQTLKYVVADRYGQTSVHPGTVLIRVLRHAPSIVALQAFPSDGYDRGSLVRIIFSESTNMPRDAVVNFTPSIAKKFALEWESETNLVVVVLEPLVTSSGLIGHVTAHIDGVVTSKDNLSVPCNGMSPILVGEWTKAPGVLVPWIISISVLSCVTVVLFTLLVWIYLKNSKSTPLGLEKSRKPLPIDDFNAVMDSSVPISILFTDIESSTKLWGRDAEVMSKALDIHHAVIRKAIQVHACYEVKTIGDGFMVACKRPIDAVKLALEIQLRMFDAFQNGLGKTIGDMYASDELRGSEESFNSDEESETHDVHDHGLRIRIGIHSDLCLPRLNKVTNRYDYRGAAVSLASRLEKVGHGGQTLVSEAVYHAVMHDLRDDVVVKDMGMNRLQGGTRVAIFQLLPVGSFAISRKFPPLRLDMHPWLVKGPEYLDDSQCSLNAVSFCLSSNNGLVKSGAIAADDLEAFVQPIMLAFHLLFSTGGEASKEVVEGLCDQWKVPYIRYDVSLHYLSYKVAIASRENLILNDIWSLSDDATVGGEQIAGMPVVVPPQTPQLGPGDATDIAFFSAIQADGDSD